MKKIIALQSGYNQLAPEKSRKRLIQQNCKLYSEIISLENKISTILSKRIGKGFEQKVQEQKFQQQHKQLTKNQISQIKKLKRKILLLKNADKPQEKQEIRLALDQLVYLKKQKEKLELQKEALLNKRKLKQQGLHLNKPIQEEQKKLISLYKAAQRQNFELKSKSLKIEKQINNLHKIKELAKTSVPKQFQCSQISIKKLQDQISRIREQIKVINKEWQPRVDSLNNEYYVLKQIKEEKQKYIGELQNLFKTSKNRVLAMKQETEIIQNRNRVSKVIISPDKRNEILEIYRVEKQKRQLLKNSNNKSQTEPNKSPQAIFKKKIKKKTESPKKQTLNELSRTEPIKIFKTEIVPNKEKQIGKQTNKNNLDFNEFQVEKPNQQIPVKNEFKKLVSIAIGTTFYYKGQDQS